jgi:hypothetical protein
VRISKQTTGEEGEGADKQTPGDVSSTIPIPEEATEIDFGKILKEVFEPSEDDNDDEVSSQEDCSKLRLPNKGPIKHQLINSQKDLEEHKRMLQDKSEMLLNTEVALTRTQGDKDKLLKEIRVVASENRRVAELMDKEKSDRLKAVQMMDKEKSERLNAERDKSRFAAQLDKTFNENEILKLELEEFRRVKREQQKENQRKEEDDLNDILRREKEEKERQLKQREIDKQQEDEEHDKRRRETDRRQGKSSSGIRDPSGQFYTFESQTEIWDPYLNPKFERVDNMQQFSPIRNERHANYSEEEVSDEDYHKPNNNKKSFPDKHSSSNNEVMEGRMKTLERNINKPILQQFVRSSKELTTLSLAGWDTNSWRNFSDLLNRRKIAQYAFEGTACLTASQRSMLLISVHIIVFKTRFPQFSAYYSSEEDLVAGLDEDVDFFNAAVEFTCKNLGI